MQETAFFGKVPSQADFLHRGLSMSRFDEWADIAASWFVDQYKDDNAAWKVRMVGAPLWRFLIPDGVINETGCYGIMAGSMDKARRVFPFFALVPHAFASCSLGHIAAVNRNVDHLEALTLAFLADEITPDGFKTELDKLLAEPPVFSPMSSSIDPSLTAHQANCLVDCHPLRGDVSAAKILSHDQLPTRPKAKVGGEAKRSLWWHEGSTSRKAELCIVQDLPYGPSFVSFFLANWKQYGWQEGDRA